MINKTRRFDIEKRAFQMRQHCITDTYGIIDIFESCDKNGFKVIRFPLGEDGILGFAQIRDEDRLICSNSSVILAREIFTVAHEMGHHDLHLDENCMLIQDADLIDRNCQEEEANYFAASLLVPLEQILLFIRYELDDKEQGKWNTLDIARMQTTFNVSFDMILNRLDYLELIDSVNLLRLKEQKSQTSVTRLLTIIDGSASLCQPSNIKKVPAEFLEWLISNYNKRLISKDTVQRTLDYFGIKADDIVDVIDINKESEEDLREMIGGIDE